MSFVVNVSAQTVYTTKTGEKFHKENCKYLKYSKKEITLQKVLKLGYTPCSVCKPPTKIDAPQNSEKLNNSTSTSNKSRAESIQCSGKTQSGTRCKRMTKDSSGKCYQHQD